MGYDNDVIVRQPGNNNVAESNGVNSTYVEDESHYRQPPPPYSPYEVSSVSRAVPPPPLPQPPHRTIIVQQQLKHGPVAYTCPTCLKRVVTRVEYVNSRKTHMIAGFVCGFTFWCMLCCLAAVPYMASTFKKAVHYCPNCKAYLGSH